MAAQKTPFITPREYLARERASQTKSEYIAGEVYAMAGGPPEHAAIASDVHVALAVALRGTSCEVYNSDLQVRVDDAGPFFYPDVTVVCGEVRVDQDDCLRNPTVIIEVLSGSTALFDRGEKFIHCRRIVSLRHYVLIEQNRVRVENYERQESGLWTLVGGHTDLSDRLTLGALGVAVPLGEIYRRVPPLPPQQQSGAV